LIYYEHHLGDYAEATSHLSFIEDAAYCRMIRKYYATEKPLPADIKAVQRLVGAHTKEERQAVDDVLKEFFELRDDGWHNARCDAEIEHYQDKQAKAKRSANARWSIHKAHSEGTADGMRTHSEGNAHQAPSTKHQSPSTNTDTQSSSPPSRAGAVCVALRSEGLASVNPQHPDLLDLLESGAELQEFIDAARIAKGKGKGFAYVLGVVKGKRADASRGPPQEPAWRVEQRERTLTAVPRIAARAQTPIPQTIDVEATNVTAIALG
jgi:uncharacterized protein YdaU (DUF1376 family)